METWHLQYLGIPWEAHATGPNSYDCWGLVYRCLENYYNIGLNRFPNIKINDSIAINSAAIKEIETGKWIRSLAPADGSVVLMSRRNVIHHIGISINGKVLHTRNGQSVALESEKTLRLLGFNRIEYYSHVCNL